MDSRLRGNDSCLVIMRRPEGNAAISFLMVFKFEIASLCSQ
jgi:hypothetical protein